MHPTPMLIRSLPYCDPHPTSLRNEARAIQLVTTRPSTREAPPDTWPRNTPKYFENATPAVLCNRYACSTPQYTTHRSVNALRP
eukprot:6957144-Alexandrium_andersonii.AAC.1